MNKKEHFFLFCVTVSAITLVILHINTTDAFGLFEHKEKEAFCEKNGGQIIDTYKASFGLIFCQLIEEKK